MKAKKKKKLAEEAEQRVRKKSDERSCGRVVVGGDEKIYREMRKHVFLGFWGSGVVGV